MGGLQRFEQRLEQAISGVFARTFRSAVQPVEVAAALQRELDNKAQVLSRQRRLVPNSFVVELSEGDLERLAPYDSTLAGELTTQLTEHAELQSYVFPGPIRIVFESADDLGTGRFRVRSQAEAEVTDQSRRSSKQRTRAVLEVNGTQHPLQPPGLVVGRGSEADLRINDPGVSRRHAEFLITTPTPRPGTTTAGPVHVEVHDMGSTNGIRVDGQKVARATLSDGSRVQIGHTSLVLRLLQETSQVVDGV
ncbi:FhaA domain-containing protein [Pimelobacter simplex]|uniref:FhaA domain-containing protein n=1 Tax=Nocardioides simplex TaxID=2045 RepID=UPI001931FB7F|nr:FHA domain-containing protein [Pimelobacter simplex]